MAIKKTTKKTSGLQISSSGFSDSKGSYDTSGNKVSQPVSSKATQPASSSSSKSPVRYSSGGVSNPSTFGFMDGSSYNADGSQVTPTRYTAPVNEIAPANPNLAMPTSLNKPTLGTVNEKKIREETRKRMQGSIDAINANYANLISQERVQAEDRSGQTRALNARSGTIGSDFGAAAQEKTSAYNRGQQKYLVDQQNAQIAAVMESIENRASAEIEARKNDALGKYQMERQDYETAKAEARADFQLLAQQGVDLNTLAPAQKMALLKQAGYDEGMGEVIYNAMKPKPAQIDYKTENLGNGRVLFYGVDPVSGELKQQIVDAGIPDDWSMTIAPDGTPIAFNKSTGETSLLGAQGQFANPLDDALKKAQIDKIYDDLASGGEDGMLSIEEATKLGVPYGTTKVQALGVVPGSSEKVAQAERSKSDIQAALDLIGSLKSHKGMDGATGFFGSRVNVFGNSRDFAAKFEQLQAMMQLGNIDKLRGTGPITESEQAVLRNAASSMRLDGDKDKLKEEFDRLEQVLNQRLQAQDSIINVGNQATLSEFESQYGGSEGADFFNQVKGTKQTAQRLEPIAGVEASPKLQQLTTKFPEGSRGGQCGDFARKFATNFGATYPRLGNSLTEKVNVVKRNGTSINNAVRGSIIVTKENPTYGHVAVIIGRNEKGFVVAESNFKQSERVSYGRIIPYNSPKIVGVINPTKV